MIESRLRAILDTAVDGMVLMDGDGVVTMFNRACETMFGYEAAEIVGGDVKRLMPTPYHEDHDTYLENYRRTGERKIIGIGREVLGLRRNGETFPLDLSVGEAKHKGKTFYVGVLRDVTEQKYAYEQFVKELAAANEERAHFVNAASHDLKEPLRMVEAFCDLLSADYGERLDEQGREYLSLAVSAARRMRRLLHDLGDFSRLESDVERVSWIDTNESLDRVAMSLAGAISAAGAKISREALPEIWGSPIRFGRVLQSLIGNSLTYTRPGVAPRIQVSAARSGEFWRFSVSDNGLGIETRHLERIFEPFKRLQAQARYHGAGLGLTISRKIVEGFGGRIWATSTPGEGSTFCFTVRVPSEENSHG
jgi:two-component system sensor kinase FixL